MMSINQQFASDCLIIHLEDRLRKGHLILLSFWEIATNTVMGAPKMVIAVLEKSWWNQILSSNYNMFINKR